MGLIVTSLVKVIENIVHEAMSIVRDYFEILFITAIYFGGAYILYIAGMREELSYWLTSGALIGSIVTMVNRYGATRYKNGDSTPPSTPPAETKKKEDN